MSNMKDILVLKLSHDKYLHAGLSLSYCHEWNTGDNWGTLKN